MLLVAVHGHVSFASGLTIVIFVVVMLRSHYFATGSLPLLVLFCFFVEVRPCYFVWDLSRSHSFPFLLIHDCLRGHFIILWGRIYFYEFLFISYVAFSGHIHFAWDLGHHYFHFIDFYFFLGNLRPCNVTCKFNHAYLFSLFFLWLV